MTKIKLCGLTRMQDIDAANGLMPEYVGFVFAQKSKRCVTPERAAAMRARLAPGILAVGVFVDADVRAAAGLLAGGIIDIAQLHGGEDEAYISALRSLTRAPIIKAFRIRSAQDIEAARRSAADLVLLDSGRARARRLTGG